MLQLNLFRSICSNTSIMQIPINPLVYPTYHVLAPIFQINFNRNFIRVFMFERVNIFPIFPDFHDDDSCWRKFVVKMIGFHLSQVFLVQWDNVFAALWDLYLDVFFYRFFKWQFETCVNVEWVNFTNGNRTKVFQKVLHAHIKRSIIWRFVVIEFIP